MDRGHNDNFELFQAESSSISIIFKYHLLLCMIIPN